MLTTEPVAATASELRGVPPGVERLDGPPVQIVSRWPLYYRWDHERLSHAGLPPHVRAGSALRRWQQRWIVVQDDTAALAVLQGVEPAVLCAVATLAGARPGILELAPPVAVPWLTPPGVNGARCFDHHHGNKHAKADHEAAVVMPDGSLLVLGSGSLPARESTHRWRGETLEVREGAALYAACREALLAAGAHAGAALNLEGALIVHDQLWLLQRGAGLGAHSEAAVSHAMILISLPSFERWWCDGAPPTVASCRPIDLGRCGDVAIAPTDVAQDLDGRTHLLAVAEATEESILDGAVVGAWLVADGGDRWHRRPIVAPAGGRVGKLEGLAPVPGQPGFWLAVSDDDDPDLPASLLLLDASA